MVKILLTQTATLSKRTGSPNKFGKYTFVDSTIKTHKEPADEMVINPQGEESKVTARYFVLATVTLAPGDKIDGLEILKVEDNYLNGKLRFKEILVGEERNA